MSYFVPIDGFVFFRPPPPLSALIIGIGILQTTRACVVYSHLVQP